MTQKNSKSKILNSKSQIPRGLSQRRAWFLKLGAWNLGLFVLVFSGCSGSRDKQVKEIEGIENKLYTDSANPLNMNIAREAIAAYTKFADDYSKDEKTPEFLFRAGELSMSLMKSKEAVDFFKKVYESYPDFSKAPDCLFLQGFIYENHLKVLAEAQRIYIEFIKKYPDHQLTDDAQFSLKFLGKSEEDIIKEFEKNKQDSVQ